MVDELPTPGDSGRLNTKNMFMVSGGYMPCKLNIH